MNKPKKAFVITTHVDRMNVQREASRLYESGAHPLDVIEGCLKMAEADPVIYHAGYGGHPDENGIVSLDAGIMTPGFKVGAVGDLRNYRHAISVARYVLENTNHPLIVGHGAQALAKKMGLKKENLLTAERKKQWQQWKKDPERKTFWKNAETVCVIVRDSHGDLYAGITTSGLAYKLTGRVGDSPIPGAGFYVDNKIGACIAVGNGDVFLAHCPAYQVIDLMRLGMEPEKACKTVVSDLYKHTGPRLEKACLVAMDKNGRYGAFTLVRRYHYFVYYGRNYKIKVPYLFEKLP